MTLPHRDRVPNGVLFFYGPFKLGGTQTAASNAAFDADLKRRDPRWGVRDVDDLVGEAAPHGLELREVVAMPANNHSLVSDIEPAHAPGATLLDRAADFSTTEVRATGDTGVGRRRRIEELAAGKVRAFQGTIDPHTGEYLDNDYAQNKSLSEHVAADYHGRFFGRADSERERRSPARPTRRRD